MDTKQIEYIIKIADEGSITRAAEKLFITQSALSQQLQKLEKELGAPLFVRNKSDWTLTPEGNVYVENAREMLRIKQKTYTLIADMADTHRGFLSVGMTPGRGSDMFPYVYPKFHDMYPDFTIEPRELSVRKQQEAIHKGELDIGFVTISEQQKTNDEYIDMFDEEIFLALPEQYPLPDEYLQTDAQYPEVPLSLFRYEPFVMMYKESTIRKTVDQIFHDAGFSPTVLFETSNNATILSMVSAKMACALIPYHYVKKQPEGVRFYSLTTHPTWKVCVTYQKNSYLSKAAKDFIQLVDDYWEHGK